MKWFFETKKCEMDAAALLVEHISSLIFFSHRYREPIACKKDATDKGWRIHGGDTLNLTESIACDCFSQDKTHANRFLSGCFLRFIYPGNDQNIVPNGNSENHRLKKYLLFRWYMKFVSFQKGSICFHPKKKNTHPGDFSLEIFPTCFRCKRLVGNFLLPPSASPVRVPEPR